MTLTPEFYYIRAMEIIYQIVNNSDSDVKLSFDEKKIPKNEIVLKCNEICKALNIEPLEDSGDEKLVIYCTVE